MCLPRVHWLTCSSDRANGLQANIDISPSSFLPVCCVVFHLARTVLLPLLCMQISSWETSCSEWHVPVLRKNKTSQQMEEKMKKKEQLRKSPLGQFRHFYQTLPNFFSNRLGRRLASRLESWLEAVTARLPSGINQLPFNWTDLYEITSFNLISTLKSTWQSIRVHCGISCVEFRLMANYWNN